MDAKKVAEEIMSYIVDEVSPDYPDIDFGYWEMVSNVENILKRNEV